MKENNQGLYIVNRTKWDRDTRSTIKCPIMITQFEPTEARNAFPCLDEPDRKATFSISLVVAKDKTSISNMPIKHVHPLSCPSEEDEEFEIREYLPTLKMSTYLVAFAIGDFDFLETKTNDGVKVRLYTAPSKKEQGRFALDVTKKALEFYTNFFDVPYPLPKLDLIAVPDMQCSAMVCM